MRKLTLLIVLIAGAALGAAAVMMLRPDTESAPVAAVTRYHCPMHPTIVSDKPGECPICHMRMVPDEPGANAPANARPGKPEKPKVLYRSTMNPTETADHPGVDSMGMAMVPVEIGPEGPPTSPPVEGHDTVQLSSLKRQLIGARTSPVVKRPFVRTLRLLGQVTYDETRLHHLHTKVGGWIEQLHANATGEFVKKGDPMLTIYSPELLASAQEYLLAVRSRDRLASSTMPSVRESGEALVRSARRRLELFDLGDAEIAALESRGEAPRTMTLHAPVSGHIINRLVSQGEKIESGTNLLDIADLSTVWVMADVYEYELPYVKLGQKAVMTLTYLPGRSFAGHVTLISPVVTEATRTVKVRLEFRNPDLELKPEMFADVQIESDLGVRIAVPETALVSTGERDLVFVDRGEGFFEPREVRIGLRLPDGVEILSGLTQGEQVLTSGNFFVDSESRMKAALRAPAPAPAEKAP